jgi:hypothetical protein
MASIPDLMDGHIYLGGGMPVSVMLDFSAGWRSPTMADCVPTMALRSAFWFAFDRPVRS